LEKRTHLLCESPLHNPLSPKTGQGRGDFLHHPAERDGHVSPLERGFRGVFSNVDGIATRRAILPNYLVV